MHKNIDKPVDKKAYSAPMNSNAASFQKLSRTANIMAAISLLPHFFCCVLPLVASILNISAAIGLSSLNLEFIHEPLHQYEPQLLILATVALLIGGIAQLISYRIDCRTNPVSHCHHSSCKPKKRFSSKLFMVSVVVYAINLVVFFLH